MYNVEVPGIQETARKIKKKVFACLGSVGSPHAHKNAVSENFFNKQTHVEGHKHKQVDNKHTNAHRHTKRLRVSECSQFSTCACLYVLVSTEKHVALIYTSPHLLLTNCKGPPLSRYCQRL